MSIFKNAVNIPTVASCIGSIGTYNAIAAGKIILNGPIVSSSGEVSFINIGYASSVKFTTAGNLSARTFTVVGTYNGTRITENIVGPNNASVVTNNLFHTIISINIDGAFLAAFTIDSGYNIAVVASNSNNNISYLSSNYTYSVLLNSLTAAGAWAAGGAIIYGVTNAAPTLLQVTSLTYATRASNYFSLPVTGAALAGFTQVQLNNGVSTQTNYPFAAVIVYLAAGINTTPAFIEIAQS
jgi:hypothetical protein